MRSFCCFQKFQNACRKNETWYNIKAFRSNRGSEFTYKEFDNFNETHGISLSLAIPRLPQQNRVAKRKNKIILNMKRCMLKAKNMQKKFGAKFVSCVVPCIIAL